MDPKWPKARVFEAFHKDFAINFIEFGIKWKFRLLDLFKLKSHTWENFGSWAKMLRANQIAGFLDQLYLKEKLISVLAWRCRFKKHERFFVSFTFGVVRKVLSQLDFRFFETAISQEQLSQSTWIFDVEINW